MAMVSSPLSSTLSNKKEDSFDTASNRSPHTSSRRKLKRLQSAYTDDQHGESKCKHCGWRYPTQNPDSRQRRHHKKICPKLSLDSEREIGGSGYYGSPDYGESGCSSVLTGDQEVTDTAQSRRKLLFRETEQETVTERDIAQKQAEASKEKELGSHNLPKKDPQEAHSPRVASPDVVSGNNSGVSSAADEHETDPSDDVEFESSDALEGAKREDSLQSDDDDMLEEEKKYGGASQNQHSHAQFEGGAEISHAGGEENRKDSEGEGKSVNVANLITKFENAQRPASNVDSVALAGNNKRSMPFAKNAEAGPLSLTRSKGQKNVSEIISAEEIQEEERQSSGRELQYDLELLLKKQKTHDLICPVCGSQITNRIIVRKKRRTFSREEEAQLPNLQESTSESSSEQESNVKAITASARSRGNWVERCFSYLRLFRRDNGKHID